MRRSLVAAGCVLTPGWHSMRQAAAQETTSANDRFRIGQIGCGGQGNYITQSATRWGDLLIVCDVDREHAEKARAEQGRGKGDLCEDYRHVLDRNDIDVVLIGTPDHWHSKIAVEALEAGKDVYCEKPLTLTICEGQQICEAVRRSGRVFQVGTQQRSEGPFAQALALVQNGRLGHVQRVEVAIGTAPTGGPFPAVDPPPHLNWKMWLGQAPLVPYIVERCHYQFRWWYEYSGGKMTDWGAHHVDIAHLALEATDTGPVRVEGTAVHPVVLKQGCPVVGDCFNTATEFDVLATFESGKSLRILNVHPEFENGVKIIGDQAELFVNREELRGAPVDALADDPLPEDAIMRVCKGQQHGDHMRNFFECVRARKQPISDVFSHHRALTTCHLANIAIRLGRAIRWDPKAEQIVGDDEARHWQARTPRAGFEIKA
jgi:predicted dehydrogenase